MCFQYCGSGSSCECESEWIDRNYNGDSFCQACGHSLVEAYRGQALVGKEMNANV